MLLVRTFVAPSAIDGIGLFAKEPIPVGRPVWRFVPDFDRMLPPAFEFRLPDPDFIECYAELCRDTGWYVVCLDNMRFINHSEDPNVGTVAPVWDFRVTHNALRDIAAGEEMTCDYRIGCADPLRRFADRIVQGG